MEVRERTRELVLRFLVVGIDEVLVLFSVWLRASSSCNSWVLEFRLSGWLFVAMVDAGGGSGGCWEMGIKEKMDCLYW